MSFLEREFMRKNGSKGKTKKVVEKSKVKPLSRAGEALLKRALNETKVFHEVQYYLSARKKEADTALREIRQELDRAREKFKNETRVKVDASLRGRKRSSIEDGDDSVSYRVLDNSGSYSEIVRLPYPKNIMELKKKVDEAASLLEERERESHVALEGLERLEYSTYSGGSFMPFPLMCGPWGRRRHR